MPEIRPLTDFFNPMQTGLQAMQVMNQQDSLAFHERAQAENLALHKAQLQQQQSAQEDSALTAALKEANPMERYPIIQRIMQKRGLPPPDVNSYYAKSATYDDLMTNDPSSPQYKKAYDEWLKASPESRKIVEDESKKQYALRGATQYLKQAGVKDVTPDMAELLVQSGPMQSQVSNVVAQTPLEREKYEQEVTKNAEAKRVLANVHTQEGTLIPLVSSLSLGLDNVKPYFTAMEKVNADFEKNKASMGATKAEKLKGAIMRTNPDIFRFEGNRQKQIPQLEQAIQDLNTQRTQIMDQLNMAQAGVRGLPDGQSIDTLSAYAEASGYALEAKKALLEFAKNPTEENRLAVESVKENAEIHMQGLREKKAAASPATDEKSREFNLKQQHVRDVNAAQRMYLKDKNLDAALAKYPGVTGEEIKHAEKDFNQPLVKIEEGLGKEIGPIINEGRNSAIGALDTIDTVQRAKSAIEGGQVNIGPGATVKQNIDQLASVLNISGKDTDERLSNTRSLIRSLAQLTLSARKSLKGQGQISDFEGKLLEKAESGQINDMTMPELRTFFDVTDRLARRQYENYQSQLKNIRGHEKLKEIAPFYEVPEIPSRGPKVGTVDNGYEFTGGDPSKKENWKKR